MLKNMCFNIIIKKLAKMKLMQFVLVLALC